VQVSRARRTDARTSHRAHCTDVNRGQAATAATVSPTTGTYADASCSPATGTDANSATPDAPTARPPSTTSSEATTTRPTTFKRSASPATRSRPQPKPPRPGNEPEGWVAVTEPRRCVVCDVEFTGHGNRIVCSTQCKYRRQTLRAKESGLKQRTKQAYDARRRVVPNCAACGATFKRRMADGKRRFCFDCSPPGDMRASVRLSEQYPTAKAQARRAEERAAARRAARRSAVRRKISRAAAGTVGVSTWVMGRCPECDLAFVSNQSNACFCSEKCARRKFRRDGKARRRARSTGGRVNRKKVFTRDGWRCQICGRQLKRGAMPPDPAAPTIDHVVPLSRGGAHEDWNAQACCFECNCRKGATLLVA
jgi:hypothetical protein